MCCRVVFSEKFTAVFEVSKSQSDTLNDKTKSFHFFEFLGIFRQISDRLRRLESFRCEQ